jgi:aspartokinase
MYAVRTVLPTFKSIFDSISFASLPLPLQDLTARARDSLVSFGERMSTRIFTSYLRQRGVPARQFDAPEIGFITSDDFGNAEIIYEQTLGKVRGCG